MLSSPTRTEIQFLVLHRKIFPVRENGTPQKVLSFEVHDGSKPDILPPKLPPLPADTFFDLPEEPGQGVEGDPDRAVLQGGTGPGNGAGAGTTGGVSRGMGTVSELAGDYMSEDNIAEATGGYAYYSRNRIDESLNEAVTRGASYYSLSYAPSDRKFDGELRGIQIRVEKPDYKLAYRRYYYAVPGDNGSGANSKSGIAR